MLSTSTQPNAEVNFAAVFDSSPNAMILMGLDYRIKAINQQATERIRLFWRHELKAGESILSLAKILTIPDFEEHLKNALAGKHFTEDRHYQDASLRERWFEFTYAPVKDGSGEVVAACLSFINITGRKKIEASLLSSVSTNRLLLDVMPDMFFHINRDGFFVSYKAGQGSKLYQENFIGRRVSEVLPPDVAAKTLEYVEKALQTNKLEMFEYQLEIAGTLSFFEARLIVSGENEVMVIARDITKRKQAEIVLARDITERKQAEMVLRRYQLLAENTLDIILFIRPDGTLLEANQAAALAYGYTLEELHALNIRDLRAKETITQVTAQMQQANSNGILFETRHRRKDGTLFPVEVTSHGIELNGERVLLSVIRDITERKRAEEALQYRLQFEQLIAAISTNFINVAVGEIDREINQALATIGQFSGADRSYIFLFSEDGKLMNNTHEWCGEEIEPQIEMLQDLPSDSFPWLTEQIQRLENIHLPSLDLIPEEGQNVREVLEMQAIQSLILVPMVYEKKAVGYLGFDSVKTKKSWSNDDIALLRMVGNTFISAIQRKITEQSLVEERDFAQMVVNTMGQGLVMTNIEGRFQFVNPAYARMLGYSPEELVGKSPTEFIHPEDVAKRNEAFRNSLSGKNNTYETRLIHRKGRILYVTVTAVPIYRENQFKGAIAVITDITGRKLGEIALRESEERLRSVVSNVPLMLFAVDQNEVVTFAEGRGFRELGVDPAQMVGHSIKRPFNADDISIAEKIHQALEGEETHAILPMRGKAYELWFSPVKERGEQVSSAIGVGLDVSERLRAEKALQYRLQFEQLIAAISTNFINVAVGEIDREINQALATIGQFSGADRSYIFLFSEDGKLMNNTHEWCGEEIEPQIEMLQDLPSDSFPWLTEQIQRLENIHLPSLDLIPEEGQNVREVLEMQAIQSLILVPMVYEKKAVGYLGFDVVKAKKSWSNDDIALLRMVGNTFISAIRRKITEQSLIEERDFAQMVTNTMGQGLIVLNSEGYFQFINPVFERMLGYPLEELSGKSPSEFIPPEDRYIYANALFSRIQGKTTTHEHRLIHRTGKLIYVTVTGVPLFRENQFKGIISVITDITDRKQAEEALRQSEHRLQTVVSNVPMMLFAIDQSKVITFAEGQSLKELGMEPTRMVGHSLEAPCNPTDKYLAEKVNQAMEDERVNAILPIKGRAYEFWFSPVKGAENKVAGVIGVGLDVSERVQAAEDIRQALEKEKELGILKSRFISMASHDFRTPLTAIYSSAELLENYGHRWDDVRKQKVYQRIYTSVKNMTDLLDEVLFITKSESGKLEFNPAPLDLSGFCNGLIEEIQLGPGKDYCFDLNLPPEPKQAWVDQKLLRKVLTNLLTNAVKYSPPTSTIHFELKYQEEEAVFVVRDEGMGIPEEGLNHLYEVFYRATNVASIKGTGLGLVIVKKSLEAHKGKIEIESKVGIGTCCTVTIPLLDVGEIGNPD